MRSLYRLTRIDVFGFLSRGTTAFALAHMMKLSDEVPIAGRRELPSGTSGEFAVHPEAYSSTLVAGIRSEQSVEGVSFVMLCE